MVAAHVDHDKWQQTGVRDNRERRRAPDLEVELYPPDVVRAKVEDTSAAGVAHLDVVVDDGQRPLQCLDDLLDRDGALDGVPLGASDGACGVALHYGRVPRPRVML